MLHRKYFRRTLVSSLLISLMPSMAAASGFALIETNARGQGNAYAGAAAHTPDASTIFFNPAGMTDLEGDHLTIAMHKIIPHSSFTNEGSTAAAAFAGTPFATLNGENDDGGSPAIVPNLYWVKTLSETTKFGLGVNSPFGLATEYADDWAGRYHGVVSDLAIININPSIGYKVNDKLSIGGGIDVMLGTVTLSSAIDFGAICMAQFNYETCAGIGSLPQSGDGFAELTGDNLGDISVGFNLGLKYKISDQSTIGIAYRSEVEMNVEGDADFTVPTSAAFVYAGNLFVDTGLNATVNLPASFSVSYAHQVDSITYLADATWTGWSSYEELRIEYDNNSQPDSVTTNTWEDVMRYSLGLDYQYAEDTIYRVGIAYDQSPVPSAERRTPRLPGTDRTWFSFGVSNQLDDGLSIDIGVSHLVMDTAETNNEFESSVPTLAATLTGEYEASVNIFSVQLNWEY